MAKNTGKGHRKGSVTDRTQFESPSDNNAKRNASSGKIMDVKTTNKSPFKGVAEEPDDRRTKESK